MHRRMATLLSGLRTRLAGLATMARPSIALAGPEAVAPAMVQVREATTSQKWNITHKKIVKKHAANDHRKRRTGGLSKTALFKPIKLSEWLV